MSDTDGAVADSGAIASNDPVIIDTPNPISTEPQPELPLEREEPRADAKPDKEPAKPITARDALKRAAEKVAKDTAEPSKTAAVKSEPVKAEAKLDAKVDAKADTTVEPKAETKPEQPRADDGKFAAKDADAAKPVADAKVPSDPKLTSESAKPADAKPNLPSYTASEPPKRFSPDAKEAWATAPDSVRAEVSRMEKELTQGYEKHRNDAEAFNNVREFDEMAKKSGTDLKTALTNYTNMERVLRADPIKGLELICQNAGLSLKDVAAHVMGQTPEQNASQTDATIRELRATVQQLEQKVGGVTETIQTQRTQTTHESVIKFAADHPRFDELSDDIAFFLKTRTQDLAEAYNLAERLNPAPVKPAAPAASTAPIELPKPDLAAQTAKGSKSIAGSPSAGSDPVTRQPSRNIKESLRRAMAQAG